MSAVPIGPDLTPGVPDLPRAPAAPSLRRLLRNRTAMTGLVIVLVLVVAALFAPLLAPHDPNAVDANRRFEAPSASSPLGTDELGRDTLSRLLFGARLSIGATLAAGVGVSVIGLLLGLLAGYLGGLTDTIVSRVVDSLLAFPAFLLALGVTGLLGPGLPQVTIAVVIVSWAGYARIVRASVIAERERSYVEASRALGASRMEVIRRHVLVNVAGPALVLLTLELSATLQTISALSFLGVGVEPPTAEWGGMLAEASRHLGRAPQLMVFPGAAIFLMALGFNLLGDGLRDVLDPQRG